MNDDDIIQIAEKIMDTHKEVFEKLALSETRERMKVLLLAPMYLEGIGYERYDKWLSYYIPLKDKLGYTDILFVDNASNPELIDKLEAKYPIKVIRKTKFFGRLSANAYGYWHRAFANGYKYAIDNNYDKVIHIDSDVYLFTDRICEYVKNTNTGYVGFWCDIHNYPETIFHILGKDQFQNAEQFMREDFLEYYPYDIAETRVPFTHIEKNFIGDRFPEKGLNIQQPEWDFCGQCLVSMDVKFKGTL